MAINIEKRVVEAFKGKTVTNIAEILGYNYHTFRNWINGKRDLPPEAIIKIAKTANISIDWLLTGDGSMRLGGVAEPQEFDVRASVEKHNNWRPVLEEWYDFEDAPMPPIESASFMGGWESFDVQTKVHAVEDLKKVLDLTHPEG